MRRLLPIPLLITAYSLLAWVGAPQSSDPHVCVDHLQGLRGLSGAALKEAYWQPGQTIRVLFLNGTPYEQSMVKRFASDWTGPKGANLTFTFVKPDQLAEVRVSFAADNQSWSQIGTFARAIPAPTETMHYGWFTDNTSEGEFRRTVEHEFGHALGLIHEHQSPAATISWNRQYVEQYYLTNDGWDAAKVKANVFDRYASNLTQYTTFDPKSIMLYPIPVQMTTNGFSVGWNLMISPTDLAFAHSIYKP